MQGDFIIIYQDKIFDPSFNLAAEEFLLEKQKKDFKKNLIFIYRNDASVVCGKNQSIWAEANLRYCRENGISINKRLSGGGTVYHDLGNINFSYFTPRKSEWVSNFSIFNKPIIEFLKAQKIKAHSNDRNDILIDNFKISGNAQHLSGDQMISHATLLFNADLQNVSAALNHPWDKVYSSAIQSKKVPVTNINQQGLDISVEEFIGLFLDHLSSHFNARTTSGFDKNSIAEINNKARAKYADKNWVFGNSPKTSIELFILYEKNKYQIKLELHKGIVTNTSLDPKNAGLSELLNALLIEEYFEHESLFQKIEKQNDRVKEKHLNLLQELKL